MSIVRDPETYERFERIVFVHGVRTVDELAYHDMLVEHLPSHEFLGDMVSTQLQYYPTVTREEYRNRGRIPDLITRGKLAADCSTARTCTVAGTSASRCAPASVLRTRSPSSTGC